MNWKKERELRQNQMKVLEDKRKEIAKSGWLAMNKMEKEQLRKLINFNWDKMPNYAKAKITKDSYIQFETQEHCVKFAEKIKKN
ncbi:MAG: hypothetical protein WBG30_15260 [Psychrilyobacter sp.]|uniref:hypothetical protein n=1 Tax=Psychrilyobacter sp. TaxID=2586924 RepID=UPI003C790A5F